QPYRGVQRPVVLDRAAVFIALALCATPVEVCFLGVVRLWGVFYDAPELDCRRSRRPDRDCGGQSAAWSGRFLHEFRLLPRLLDVCVGDGPALVPKYRRKIRPAEYF